MAKVIPFYGIIIVGHFCKRVAIYGSLSEQDITEETRDTSIRLWQEYCIFLGCCEAEMGSGNRNKVISLLWMGCDSNNGNPVSSRTVIPEDPIGGWCFLLDIGFKHFLSIWPL